MFFRILLWALFVVALLLFYKFVPQILPGLFQDNIAPITKLFTEIYTLFLALSLFTIWAMYYLNMNVVTEQRIVDINQVGLFSHVVAELNLDRIEDVTSESNGVLGNIFDFGNVYVQTAGTVDRFKFENIPNPGLMAKTILDQYELRMHNKPTGKTD